MIIENNGLRISANVIGNTLKFKVLEQSQNVTESIITNNGIEDEETGYKLKINRYPALNKTTNVFYLRGSDPSRNETEVEKEFESRTEAMEALLALESLANKAGTTRVVPTEGGTTHVRTALITRDQARILQLTNHRAYPSQRAWTRQVRPVETENEHYNEHIGQVVDVLNKSIGNVPASMENGIVNPHRVSSDDARYAVDAVKALFDNAHRRGEGSLVAVWRIVSGLRATDVKEDH